MDTPSTGGKHVGFLGEGEIAAEMNELPQFQRHEPADLQEPFVEIKGHLLPGQLRVEPQAGVHQVVVLLVISIAVAAIDFAEQGVAIEVKDRGPVQRLGHDRPPGAAGLVDLQDQIRADGGNTRNTRQRDITHLALDPQPGAAVTVRRLQFRRFDVRQAELTIGHAEANPVDTDKHVDVV